MVSAKLISIIGPPAVGKTTLAERLAERLPAGLIREDYAGNPFLADAYAGVAEADLPSQLYFLMSRVRQLAVHAWPGEGIFVTDYGFCQDGIYARARLSSGDLRLYDHVAGCSQGLVRPPDVMICLDADEATLLERIARRGRPYEKAITAEFLAAMRAAYNEVRPDGSCHLVRLDCGEDAPSDAAALASLTDEIRRHL